MTTLRDRLTRWFDKLITTIAQRIADRITAPTPSADTYATFHHGLTIGDRDTFTAELDRIRQARHGHSAR